MNDDTAKKKILLVEDDEALATHGFVSLTTSGKIQLVRRRLGLRRPKRLKK